MASHGRKFSARAADLQRFMDETRSFAGRAPLADGFFNNSATGRGIPSQRGLPPHPAHLDIKMHCEINHNAGRLFSDLNLHSSAQAY